MYPKFLTISVKEDYIISCVIEEIFDSHCNANGTTSYDDYTMISTVFSDSLTGVDIASDMTWRRDGAVCLCISPDGKYVAAGTDEGKVFLSDITDGTDVASPLLGHSGSINCVSFSRDGTFLITGSADKTIRMWDAKQGQEALPPLKGHEGTVVAIDITPDDARLVSSSEDTTVRVWNLMMGTEMYSIKGSQLANYVAFSPAGTQIAACFSDALHLWSAEQGESVISREIYSTAVEFSGDGKYVASQGNDAIILWDAVSLTKVKELPLSRTHTSMSALAFYPDGNHIVFGTNEGNINVWELSTVSAEQPSQRRSFEGAPVTFSPDQVRLATFNPTVGALCIVDANTGATLPLQFHGHRQWGMESIAFSSDGDRIVARGSNAISVWDANSGEQIFHIAGVTSGGSWKYVDSYHRNPFISNIISSDGSRVACLLADEAIQVWDVAPGAAMLPLLNDVT